MITVGQECGVERIIPWFPLFIVDVQMVLRLIT